MKVAIRFINVPGTEDAYSIVYEVAPGLSYESIAEHYTSNAQELAYLRDEFYFRPRFAPVSGCSIS
jgi:hypothetical protein